MKNSDPASLPRENLDNLTPADVFFGRRPTTLKQRRDINLKTIAAAEVSSAGRLKP